MKKIGLLGAGHIGGTIAHLALMKGLGSVVLFDVIPGLAAGKALDLSQSGPLEGWGDCVRGTDHLEDLAGCDVLIVTAGLPRTPGMSRSDLLLKNAQIMQTLGEGIRTHVPDAIVIVVTNPLDAMVGVMQEATGFAPERVMGMAGILDSARFRLFLAQALDVAPQEVQALVLGGHGDLMVPLVRYASVAGIPLCEWITSKRLSAADLEVIIQRTRQGGGEIVDLLKKGSAFYTPASAALVMAQAILRDEKRLLPCAAYLRGEYGQENLYAGVPVTLGRGGVEKIWEFDLTEDEKACFNRSVATVRELMTTLSRTGSPQKGPANRPHEGRMS